MTDEIAHRLDQIVNQQIIDELMKKYTVKNDMIEQCDQSSAKATACVEKINVLFAK